MALRHAVLAALLEGEASGYQLAKRFDVSVANFWSATPQQLYRELDAKGWELYDLSKDPTESNNLADANRAKLIEMIALWYVEAGKYDVLPLDNRGLADLVAAQPLADIPEGGIYRYYPGATPLPEFNAAPIRGRSFKILAQVDLTDPDAEGVLMAVGSRHGGHALFIKNRKLWYVNNFIGIPPDATA